MESISLKVRAMYESFPYPSRGDDDLFDIHPRLCLSYRSGSRRRERLRILDAGCGTGAFSLGTAFYNRDCQVTAADFNRAALNRIRDESAALALPNLKVAETDLNTLQGLEVPSQGYDMIICGGVLHHLAHPLDGLKNLANTLAPHGVMRLMVYNTLGRQALTRYVKALALVQSDADQPGKRLALARTLFSSVPAGPLRQAPWGDGGDVDDVEFVDRYLHPLETSYSVAEYLDLLEAAGLVFLRWHEPLDWNLERYIDDPVVLTELQKQPETIQHQLVEHLSNQVFARRLRRAQGLLGREEFRVSP
jgi:SAM-dependent methyltransferase